MTPKASSLSRSILALSLIQGSFLGAHAQRVVTIAADYPTMGNPTSALATRDGRYVFVSVTNVGRENFRGPDSAAGARKDTVSGIQIFRHTGNLLSPNHSGGLKSMGFIRLGGSGANGLTLLQGGETLAVGVGDAGVAFLNVKDAVRGSATPYFAPQGDGAGTFDVVATPDGKYVFSSNEYGVFQGQRGNVGIVEVNADDSGRVTHPKSVGQIRTGDVVPSLTISPDGSRLYVATELVPSNEPPYIAGADNAKLTKNDCVQKKGTPPRTNGFITVLNVKRAIDAPKNAVLSRIAAGCSPVRLVEAQDTSKLFVSARGDNLILAFDPQKLESDPEHALLRSLSSEGEAPVGLRLFAQDRLLAVANSNRFADSPGTVAILDVSEAAQPTLLKTWTAGVFPRNISLSENGNTLYLTNYSSRSLQTIQVYRP